MKPYDTEQDKKEQVREMFDRIAPAYDRLNHTLSFQIDKLWRRHVVRIVRRMQPRRILDVATGTGDLALAMARRMRKALYNDVLQMKEEDEVRLGITYCTIKEIIEKSDIISLHCPLTTETKHIIDNRAVNKMKNGVILINTARGGLIDEIALVNGIKSGKIAGVGIDVYEREPVENNELLQLKKVITTPHIGGVTYDSFYQMMHDAMRNIEMFDKGQLQEIENSRYIF